MQKNLLFEQSAVIETLKELRAIKNYSWNNIKYINHHRYAIIYGNPNIAILLKTEPFFTFGNKFKDSGETGVGDTVNCKHLKEFITNRVKTIYTKFRDGKLYEIELKELLRKSHKWLQKEGTLVRSFSIHRYKRVN